MKMYKAKKGFYDELVKLAIPITIQSLFQSSMSVIDQMMVGSLGSVSIAGIGLGGKLGSLFLVTVSALCTAASILIAQYVGAKDQHGIRKSFWIYLVFAMAVCLLFTAGCLIFPKGCMRFYSRDEEVIKVGAEYLAILAVGFIPMTISLMISTLFRSTGKPKFPMYASVLSIVINTGLNYLLIFGKCGCPSLGAAGAAWATTISRGIECLFGLLYWLKEKPMGKERTSQALVWQKDFLKMVWKITYPILLCEFLWGLGETIYARIYGYLGTTACAAMTLTGPIQSLVIGGFTGVAAATGIMVGNQLGAGNQEAAYTQSKTFIKIGGIGTLILGGIVALTAPIYVQIFKVESEVMQLTILILRVYAVIVPVKVLNMIAEGGILRSGGKTKYTLILDLIGTWGIGIPLGILSGYVWKLPIYEVYGLLSLEEVVRLVMTMIIFKQRKWMNQLSVSSSSKELAC